MSACSLVRAAINSRILSRSPAFIAALSASATSLNSEYLWVVLGIGCWVCRGWWVDCEIWAER